jgi:hypothetical protein
MIGPSKFRLCKSSNISIYRFDGFDEQRETAKMLCACVRFKEPERIDPSDLF